MAALLKVGARDFSRYLRTQPDAGLDPADPGRIVPVFGGNPALGDGQIWIADTADNKEWTVPLFLKARPAALTNLLDDPSFETLNSPAVWLASNCTVAQSSSPKPVAGSNVAKLTNVSGATNNIGVRNTNDRFAVTAGKTYSAAAYFQPDSTATPRSVRVYLDFYDGTNARVQLSQGGDVAEIAGGWVRAPVTAVAPGAAVTAQIIVEVAAAPNGEIHYTDAAMVTASSGAVDYFDGDSLDAEWSGTPHASSSVCYAGPDGVLAMVRKLKAALTKGTQVEFRPDGASQSTFFDLERGQFKEEYNHFRLGKGVQGGQLKLWTRPHGNTGTTRLVASISGPGPQQVAATGIMGDTAAFANLALRTGSVVASSGIPRIAVWAVTPNASHVTAWSFAASLAVGGGTVIGASGAIGSQARGLAAFAPGGVQESFYWTPGGPQTPGHYRLFLVGRNVFFPASAISFQAVGGLGGNGINGASVVATLTSATQWQMWDLGEIEFSRLGSSIPTQAVGVWVQAAAAASAVVAAPSTLMLNTLLAVPIDYGAGVMCAVNGPGNGVRQLLTFESYPRAHTYGPGAGASSVAGDLTPYVRGDRPRLPVTGTSMPSGPVQVLAFQGQTSDFYGSDLVDLAVSARESFTFLR